MAAQFLSVLSKMNPQQLAALYSICTDLLRRLKESGTFDQLMDIHKKSWMSGVQHPALGPDKYGMFRCQDIGQMTADQLFLGNINGLFTHSAQQWDDMRQQGRVSSEDYGTLMNQYRNILSSSINTIKCSIYDHGIDRERLCDLLGKMAQKVGMNVSGLRIDAQSLKPGDLHSILFRGHDGQDRRSSLLVMNNPSGVMDVFVPDRWVHGVNVGTRKEVGDCRWRNLRDGQMYDLRPSLMNKIGLDRDLSHASKLKV